jgi:hypothetical protein
VLETVRVLLADRPDITPITMFGHPSFKAGGRMFACVYDGGLGLKLPEPQVHAAMTQPDISAFSPYGKSMPAWIFIEHDDAAAYEHDQDLLEAAIAHAVTVGASPRRPRAPRKRRAAQS